jgi:hypothetical protein
VETESGSTRSHSVENSLWKKLRNCHKTYYEMNERELFPQNTFHEGLLKLSSLTTGNAARFSVSKRFPEWQIFSLLSATNFQTNLATLKKFNYSNIPVTPTFKTKASVAPFNVQIFLWPLFSKTGEKCTVKQLNNDPRLIIRTWRWRLVC